MGIDMKTIIISPVTRFLTKEEKVVKELKQMAKKADEVWLASDEDREGESISWRVTIFI